LAKIDERILLAAIADQVQLIEIIDMNGMQLGLSPEPYEDNLHRLQVKLIRLQEKKFDEPD